MVVDFGISNFSQFRMRKEFNIKSFFETIITINLSFVKPYFSNIFTLI